MAHSDGPHANAFTLQASYMDAVVSDEGKGIAAAIHQDVLCDKVQVSTFIAHRPAEIKRNETTGVRYTVLTLSLICHSGPYPSKRSWFKLQNDYSK